jgi:hypothetical protein
MSTIKFIPRIFSVLLVAIFLLAPVTSGFGYSSAGSIRSEIAQAASEPQASKSAADLPIYDDALAGGWQDWSWDTTHNFDNADPIHSGSASIAVAYTAAWGGLLFHTDTALSTSGYTAIRFWVHGGSTGSQSVNFHISYGGVSYPFTVQANTWQLVTVPLATLGNPTTLSDLFWQDGSGNSQPTYYLDDISLVGTPPFNGWLVLNGTDKYASAPYQSELDLRGGSFTVEMWIKLADAVLSTSSYDVHPIRQLSGFKFFINKTQFTDNSQFPPIYIYRYCNHFVLYPGSGSCWWVGSDTGTFLGTSWGHLAGVYDEAAGETVLYWNGQILERVTATQSTDTPGELIINHYWDDGNLLGLADEVRISDIVRYSDSFTPPTAPFVCDANTKALWHFDEPEGSTVFHDSCGAVDNYLTGYNGAHTEGVQPCYTLTRTHTGTGSDPTASPTNSSSCSSGQYHTGESISLMATPAAGWAVGSWVGTNNDTSTSATNNVTMPSSDRTVTANYTQNEYTLTITSTHGTVDRNPDQATYHEGDVVQLTATPDAGWSFANWTGGLTGSANPGSVTIHGNTSVTANYTQNEYTLTITSAHGTVASNPDQTTYYEGDVVQLTATPNAGWTFANWIGGLTSADNPGFVTVHGNTSVTANYTQNAYTLFLPLVLR